jgi:hypothetical protein
MLLAFAILPHTGFPPPSPPAEKAALAKIMIAAPLDIALQPRPASLLQSSLVNLSQVSFFGQTDFV